MQRDRFPLFFFFRNVILVLPGVERERLETYAIFLSLCAAHFVV